jgi:PPOX class probable F420-dependent enzyme
MTTFPDTHRDLLDAPVASLTTIDGKGYPQSTLTWFLHEDGELKLSLNEDRLKTRHLRKRPQCSLLIPDYQNPMRYLEVRGEARMQPDPDYEFARRVGAKYDADLRQFDPPGSSRVVVTIDPVNVYAVDMSAG